LAEVPIQDEISKARRGDRDALNHLLAANHERLSYGLRTASRRAPERRSATSDTCQSTYLDVVLAVPTFRRAKTRG